MFFMSAIHAVKDISFHVFEGEIVSLIGSNGAGKTSILKAISGSPSQRGLFLLMGKTS